VTHKKLYSLIAIFLFCTGCDVTQTTPSISTPEFVTATLPPTALPAATQTAPLPTVAPTIVPISGSTTTEVNVRAETSTASASLGTIGAFSPIQIIGKDASGYWVQIVFSSSPTGTGWVRADYVQVTDATAEIPVVDAGTGNGSALRGVVLRGVNVRNGPGKDFGSLGLLNQNDVVPILGKDSSGTWVKIEYPASPDGAGWVALEFLQVENPDAIPVLNENAQPTEAATNAVGIETPLVFASAKAALTDGDTAEVPLALFTISAASARAFQFQGEVSAPDGDGVDWIGFSSQSKNVVIQVLCDSTGIQVELQQIGGTPNLLSLSCGGVQKIQVNSEQVYLLRVSPITSGSPIYIYYNLKIKSAP
jgi:uncharacterized protein YraI